MSKSSPSPPAAPDPAVTAAAQTGSNIDTAIANARLNRVNQTTPWGSITYTQGPADSHGVPTYSSQITLSPEQQALLNLQQSGQLSRGQLANSLLSQVGGALSRPLDLSGLPSLYQRPDAPQTNMAPSAPAPVQTAPQQPIASPPSGPKGQGAQPSRPANGFGPKGAASDPAAVLTQVLNSALYGGQAAATPGVPLGQQVANRMLGGTKPLEMPQSIGSQVMGNAPPSPQGDQLAQLQKQMAADPEFAKQILRMVMPQQRN